MSIPRFSVIVPSRDRPFRIRACLEALASLDYPLEEFEIVVVDDGSREPLSDLVRMFRDRLRLRVLRQSARGPAAARNAGLALARGEIVAFTDDDCEPQRDWLRALEDCFAVQPAAGVGGRVENGVPGNVFSASTSLLLRLLCEHLDSTGERRRFFTSNNLAFPRTELSGIGNFREELLTGEDRDLCYRWTSSGRDLLYAPNAVVHHFHPLGLAEFLNLHFRYGRGSAQFRRAAEGDGVPAPFEPPAFYLRLIGHPMTVSPDLRALGMSGLLSLAEAANAAGYIRQRLFPDRSV